MDLTHMGLNLGLDVYRFDATRDGEAHRRKVESDYTSGQRSGVRKTPTFFINGVRYEGPLDVNAMVEAAMNAGPRISPA